MRSFTHMLLHEIRMLALSASTYITGVLFLTLMGLMYLVILGVFSIPQETLPSTELFKIFWIPIFFMVPLLTMKSIADERRTRTLETLKTTPVSSASIVLSKFLSCYLLYMLLWGITLLFPYLAQWQVPSLQANGQLFDSASLIGGYAFIALSGFLYIALGILASSLTRSLLVAGMLTFSFLFLFMVGGRLVLELPFLDLPWIENLEVAVGYLQTFEHLNDFSRGILDSRPFLFYLCNSLVILGITTIIVEEKI